MKDEYEKCERCDGDTPDKWMNTIDLDGNRRLCDGCVAFIDDGIENNDWQDRYTEEHHEQAVSVLAEQDEIECVMSNYDNGSIIVHTPYVSADVVVDFCRHYGLRITDFSPVWSMETELPCVADHGDTFQITLRYLPDSPMPSLVEAKFNRNRIDDLADSDKQF